MAQTSYPMSVSRFSRLSANRAGDARAVPRRVERLTKQNGRTAKHLTDLLPALVVDCPKRGSVSVYGAGARRCSRGGEGCGKAQLQRSSRLIIDHFSQPLLLLRGQVGPVAKHPPPSAPANHVRATSCSSESRFAPSCFVLFTEALVKAAEVVRHGLTLHRSPSLALRAREEARQDGKDSTSSPNFATRSSTKVQALCPRSTEQVTAVCWSHHAGEDELRRVLP